MNPTQNRSENQSHPPLKPLEELEVAWFVNRKEYLDYFWEWGNSIPLFGRHSIAFAGLRPTGKTAILHNLAFGGSPKENG